MRIATVDVGTNTVLCSVIERSEAGACTVVSDRACITGLGQGVDGRGLLDAAAVRRTLDALGSFAAEARAEGATRLIGVGTSALRDARDRDSFVLPARAILDRFDVIDGVREAALTYVGALFGLDRPPGSVTVVDIGGGSTEIIRGSGRTVDWSRSLDVGSVRLFERHLVGVDRASRAQLESIAGEVDRALAPISLFRPLVLVAGTATNVAAVALGRDLEAGARVPHGEMLPRSALEAACDRIASAGRAERRAMVGIERGREDVIVAGAIIVRRVLARAERTDLEVDAILISNGGVRFGLALEHLEAADRRPPEPC